MNYERMKFYVYAEVYIYAQNGFLRAYSMYMLAPVTGKKRCGRRTVTLLLHHR